MNGFSGECTISLAQTCWLYRCPIYYYILYYIPLLIFSTLIQCDRKPPEIRASNQSQHISVIYIDKVNGMECVRACWLGCDCDSCPSSSSSFSIRISKHVRLCAQKFAFLVSVADIVTRQTEVVYKELHLKGTQQCTHFPFMSKERQGAKALNMHTTSRTCNFYGL